MCHVRHKEGEPGHEEHAQQDAQGQAGLQGFLAVLIGKFPALARGRRLALGSGDLWRRRRRRSSVRRKPQQQEGPSNAAPSKPCCLVLWGVTQGDEDAPGHGSDSTPVARSTVQGTSAECSSRPDCQHKPDGPLEGRPQHRGNTLSWLQVDMVPCATGWVSCLPCRTPGLKNAECPQLPTA